MLWTIKMLRCGRLLFCCVMQILFENISACICVCFPPAIVYKCLYLPVIPTATTTPAINVLVFIIIVIIAMVNINVITVAKYN